MAVVMESPKLLYKVDIKRLETKSDLKSVCFTKPRLVSFYYLNYGTIKPAKKVLYFKMPAHEKYPLDLNKGYETYIKPKHCPVSRVLDCTLTYAMSPKAQVNTNNVDNIKVFARRGTLVDIMFSCYSKKNRNCTLLVSRYNGNLYMVHLDEDSSELNEIQQKHTHHEQFLKYVFTESLKKQPNSDEPIDENKRLMGVHKSSFGKFEMIYHGEIQGIQSNKEIQDFEDLDKLDSCYFVMAKQMWGAARKDDSKMFRYWLQSYLANISRLFFACKDRDGIVQRPIWHRQPSQLLKENNWKPGICTEFLYEFLQRVNDLMTHDDINSLKTVYEFYFDSKAKTFTYKVFKENTEKIFITPEYMEYCKQL